MEDLRDFGGNFVSQQRDDFACLELARSSPQALFWALPATLKSSIGLGRPNIIKESYNKNQFFLERARIVEIIAHDPNTELSDILVFDEKFQSYYQIANCYVLSTNPSFHYTISVSMRPEREKINSVPVYTESEARAHPIASRTNCRGHALYLLPSSLPVLPLSADTIEHLLRASGRYEAMPEPDTVNVMGSDGVLIVRALRHRPPDYYSLENIVSFAKASLSYCPRLRDLLISVVQDVFIDSALFFFARYWKPSVVRTLTVEQLKFQMARVLERPFEALFVQNMVSVKSVLQFIADQNYAYLQPHRSDLPVPPITPRRRVNQLYAQYANSYRGINGTLQQMLQQSDTLLFEDDFVHEIRWWKLAWERMLSPKQTDGAWPFYALDLLAAQWTLFYMIPPPASKKNKKNKRARKSAAATALESAGHGNKKINGRGMPQMLKTSVNIISPDCSVSPPAPTDEMRRLLQLFSAYTNTQLQEAVLYYATLNAAHERLGVAELRVERHPALHLLHNVGLVVWVGANGPVEFVEDDDDAYDPRILIQLTRLETETKKGILTVLLYMASKFTLHTPSPSAAMLSTEFKTRLPAVLATRQMQYFAQHLCEHPIIVLDHPTINRDSSYDLVAAMRNAFDCIIYPGQQGAATRLANGAPLWFCFVGVERWTPRELFKTLCELVKSNGTHRTGPFRLLMLADLQCADITGTLKYLKNGFSFGDMKTVTDVDPIELLEGRATIQQENEEIRYIPLRVDTTYRTQFFQKPELLCAEWQTNAKNRKKLRLNNDEVFTGQTLGTKLIKYRLVNVNFTDINGINDPKELYTLYSYTKYGFCL